MFTPPQSRWSVPFDGSFDVRAHPTRPAADPPAKKELRRQLTEVIKEIDDLQYRLFVEDSRSLLLIFQALDAAGKDSTIRSVFRGVNPAGLQVTAFAEPSSLDLDHDFLWRTNRVLPQRGRLGVFNRSYYEEVLVVRVHPELLKPQRLPAIENLDDLWEGRLTSIRDHESHLARNGTTVLKFWLNVSRKEQAKRLRARVEGSEKQWKFSMSDVRDRSHWDAYLDAYQGALNATSRPWAPWYAIPADNKPYMRLVVANIIADTLRAMDPQLPQVEPIGPEERRRILDLLDD
ncbi:MAG: polyphosphate kinase 2 family protein [Dehalococcoidia bacterium]|nr:polyphosphate kinase 2 family protein [Dehalococcoidia bacterium]